MTVLVLAEFLSANPNISPITTALTSTTTTAQTTSVSTSPTVSEARESVLHARAKTGISTRAVSYPDCDNPNTYLIYSTPSQYKTLDNDISWDWANRKSCNLTHILIPPEPDTCGDCDFKLTGGAWYKFPVGALGQIVAFPDGRNCPQVGHCNGHGQISIIPSPLPPGHPSAKYFGVLISNNPNIYEHSCFVGDLKDPSQMVQAFQCPSFTLFQFPKASWDLLDPDKFCKLDLNDTVVPVPSSICLGDKMHVLQGDRRYYTQDIIVSCSNTESPSSPASITWIDQDSQDITSQTIRDSTLSNSFTEVYNLNTSTLTSVTCQVDDKSHTFYRVSIGTENVTGMAEKKVVAICNFTLDKFSSEDEENLYFIKHMNDSEVYYTASNISVRGDKIVITEEESGTYKAALVFTDTSIPENVTTWTENWSCGLRDPIARTYTTVPFSLTLTKQCKPGTGFPNSYSLECVACGANTFSFENRCEACPEGQISEAGSEQCQEERDWGKAVYYVFAGVGAAFIIIVVLAILAIVCNRRRSGKGKNDVVISNPGNKNSVKMSRTSV